MRNLTKSIHHIVPKSVGGSNSQINTRSITDSFHKAFHRVFENRAPIGQIGMLVHFNEQVLTNEFKERVNDLLNQSQDLDFVYKKGVLVPRDYFLNKK